MRRACCALVLAVAALASEAAAQAPEAEAVFAEVATRLSAFEYAEAIALLEGLIARQPSPAVELRARSLVVRAEASRGQEQAARDAAEALYRRDPGFRLPDDDSLSPRIRAYFVEAERRARGRPPAALRVRAHAASERLRLRLSSPTAASVARVVVGVRDASGEYAELDARPAAGGGYELVIPRAPALRYYARFLAPSGYVVAEAGSPEVPLSWTDTGGALSAERAPEPVDGGGADLTGILVALGVGAAVVIAAVAILFAFEPWAAGPTINRGLELP